MLQLVTHNHVHVAPFLARLIVWLFIVWIGLAPTIEQVNFRAKIHFPNIKLGLDFRYAIFSTTRFFQDVLWQNDVGDQSRRAPRAPLPLRHCCDVHVPFLCTETCSFSLFMVIKFFPQRHNFLANQDIMIYYCRSLTTIICNIIGNESSWKRCLSKRVTGTDPGAWGVGRREEKKLREKKKKRKREGGRQNELHTCVFFIEKNITNPL